MSLILSIVGILNCPIILSIAAIILGNSARKEIAASRGWQTGDSYAKVGIIIGWIGLALYVILIIAVLIAAAVENATLLPSFL